MNRKKAAVVLQEQMQREAARLAPGDPSTQDELRQHMTTAVLSAKKKYATEGYFAKLARCRALDWLRDEKKRTRLDLKMRGHQRSEHLSFESRRRPRDPRMRFLAE